MKPSAFAHFGLVLAFLALLAVPPQGASAQIQRPGSSGKSDDFGLRPPPSSPYLVAQVYHKMAGNTPYFEEWAKRTEEYTIARTYEKLDILQRLITGYETAFESFDPNVILRADFLSQISRYDRENGTYTFLDFNKDTAFKFTLGSRKYALVPINLGYLRTIPIHNLKLVRYLEQDMRQSRFLNVHFIVRPVSADYKAAKLDDGELYRLIAVEILGLEIWKRGHRIHGLYKPGYEKDERDVITREEVEAVEEERKEPPAPVDLNSLYK